jgi:hypothetical protein
MLQEAVDALGEEADRVVFTGGAIVPLLARGEPLDVRMTVDVDCIVPVTLVAYYDLLQRLSARGLAPAPEEGAPTCRLVRREPRLVLDLMPADPNVLGFSSRWYIEAVENALTYELPGGRTIKAVSPIYFIATKLEAFRSRGGGDLLTSHDLEDVVAVLAANHDLVGELRIPESAVAQWVRETLENMLSTSDFAAAIPGMMMPDDESQERAAALVQRLLQFVASRKVRDVDER